jgi:hypothetical protein
MSISVESTDLVEEASALAFYTPGHARRKLLMVFLGVAMCLFGLFEIWTPLRLLVFGMRTTAEATRVIKTKEGMPDLVLTDDVQIKEKQEARDRSYVFWNEFRFQTVDGRDIVVRSPIGSQLKPLYSLIDEDGLPTEVLVCYDPHRPGVVAFPTIFSTWFAPGALIVIGGMCALIGLFLFAWAHKPISLPRIAAASSEGVSIDQIGKTERDC